MPNTPRSAFGSDRATPRPADLLAAVVEIGRRLPAIENDLAACGVAVRGRAGVGWLNSLIRAAFDPGRRHDVARMIEAGSSVDWSEAGPVAATELVGNRSVPYYPK